MLTTDPDAISSRPFSVCKISEPLSSIPRQRPVMSRGPEETWIVRPSKMQRRRNSEN